MRLNCVYQKGFSFSCLQSDEIARESFMRHNTPLKEKHALSIVCITIK